jgi:hypothetical protein
MEISTAVFLCMNITKVLLRFVDDFDDVARWGLLKGSLIIPMLDVV